MVLDSFRIVFSNKPYIILASAVFTSFWIVFSVLGELLFFTPVFVFYLPADAVPVFVLSNVISGLMGIVLSMNVYVFKNVISSTNKSSIFGSSVGMVAGGCASCSSLGFVLLTSFGSLGVAVSTFLTTYQIPLLLGSIGLLLWSYYSIHSKITNRCIVKKF